MEMGINNDMALQQLPLSRGEKRTGRLMCGAIASFGAALLLLGLLRRDPTVTWVGIAGLVVGSGDLWVVRRAPLRPSDAQSPPAVASRPARGGAQHPGPAALPMGTTRARAHLSLPPPPVKRVS